MFCAKGDIVLFLVIVIVSLIGHGLRYAFRKLREANSTVPPPRTPQRPRRENFEPQAAKKPKIPEEEAAVKPVSAPKSEPVPEKLGECAPFDYADFLQRHGREAVVLQEILLSPDSRASQEE